MTPARAEAGLSIKNVVVNKAVFIPKDGFVRDRRLDSDGWKPRFFCDFIIKLLGKNRHHGIPKKLVKKRAAPPDIFHDIFTSCMLRCVTDKFKHKALCPELPARLNHGGPFHID